jgi:DNA-binding MarR family transcriptional regulator
MGSLEEEIKQSKFKNESQKAILNLIFTGNWISGIHKKFFDKYDLSNEQYNVLRILRGQNPNPCTIQIINERMLDKMSNVSRLVEKLRAKSLVSRKVSSADRRQVDVVISQKGLDLLQVIDSEIGEIHSLVDGISEAEAKTLNTILDKLRS